MSIVAQISAVQPNTEVSVTSSSIEDPLEVDASLSDIQTFINEISGSEFTQVTFQQGTYQASGDITVPDKTFVIIMPGADVSSIDFVDSNTNPSPNVIDLNVLRSGSSGGGGVVFEITTNDTITQSSTTGSVNLEVNLGNDPNKILLNNVSGSGGLTDISVGNNEVVARDSGSLGTISVGNNEVVARDGGDLGTIPLNANQIIARVGSSAIDGLDVSQHSIVGRSANDLLDIPFTSNTILARFGSGSLESKSVNNNELILRGSGDLKTESVSTDQTIANLGSGLQSVDLSGSSFHNALSLTAEDIGAGTFPGGSYTFSGSLDVNDYVEVDNYLDVDTIQSGSGSITLDVNSITLDTSSVSVTGDIDMNLNDITEISELETGSIFDLNRNSEINLGSDIVIDPGFLLEIDAGSLDYVFDTANRQFDIPILSTNAAAPPSNKVRVFASQKSSGNSSNLLFTFVEPSGGYTIIDIGQSNLLTGSI